MLQQVLAQRCYACAVVAGDKENRCSARAVGQQLAGGAGDSMLAESTRSHLLMTTSVAQCR
jgi:hypothetical protein